MANIIEINGNIFESNSQTIVNTVNCVGVMGKGIALEFKKRYPEMFKVYAEQCKKGLIKPGILYLYKKSSPWILNFPTKNHWKHPSKLEYIELGLQKFSNEYQKKGIISIAFPLLGTMNGGLKWTDVKVLMYKYLSELENLDVEIYHYNDLKEVETNYTKKPLEALQVSDTSSNKI
ncbi:MAG: macro domain-containing protein [Ignavibacteria bacterium]|nr:macro domain-containing protein [Ignavibacteria bacterium]